MSFPFNLFPKLSCLLPNLNPDFSPHLNLSFPKVEGRTKRGWMTTFQVVICTTSSLKKSKNFEPVFWVRWLKKNGWTVKNSPNFNYLDKEYDWKLRWAFLQPPLCCLFFWGDIFIFNPWITCFVGGYSVSCGRCFNSVVTGCKNSKYKCMYQIKMALSYWIDAFQIIRNKRQNKSTLDLDANKMYHLYQHFQYYIF